MEDPYKVATIAKFFDLVESGTTTFYLVFNYGSMFKIEVTSVNPVHRTAHVTPTNLKHLCSNHLDDPSVLDWRTDNTEIPVYAFIESSRYRDGVFTNVWAAWKTALGYKNDPRTKDDD